MKHFISFLLFLTLSAGNIFAQSVLLTGRIVDMNTQEGISYVSMGIEGTFFGTTSDTEGFFELNIPSGYRNGQLKISTIGYVSQALPINDLLSQDFVRIMLKQQVYMIREVGIAAQSRVLFRIVRTAATKVPDNCHAGPLGLKIYYQEEQRVNDGDSRRREAIVDLFDKTGYGNPSVADAFDNRGYRFTQARRNFEPWSFPDGQTGLDELLEMDIARLSNTIFEESLLSDYDLHLEGKDLFEGDTVWIVSYKSIRPGLAHTGDFYGASLTGRLYILQSNYALLRNECFVEADRNSIAGRSLAATNNPQTNVSYHFITSYGKYNDRYVLSNIRCDKTYTDAKGAKVKYTRTAGIIDFTSAPDPITGRTFFEDTPYVEDFWNNFSVSDIM